MKKKDTDKFLAEIISGIPYCIYALIIIPLIGVLSHSAFVDYAHSESATNNTIILLIIIFSNLIVLLGILYAFNSLTKFNYIKFLVIGGAVFLVTVIIAVKAYLIYSGKDLHGAEGLLAFKNYGQAKGICLIYTIYFILTFLINRIVEISIKNKKLKSSR